ncbi:MAG: AAA family ATPase [Lacrimispora sp.]|uniref:AAA family ATPase n=1 Tax=Lacrimispora sp. TaxID=2719234 RepID=UPI0039E35A01
MKIKDGQEIFKEKGLANVEVIEYSEKKNLIIGANGCGKTRFLLGIRDYYSHVLKYQSNQIIYANFPALSYKYKAKENIELEDSLFDTCVNNLDCSFDQFLILIENDCMNMIAELLQFKHFPSRHIRRGQRIETVYETINRFLKSLLDIEIQYYDNEIYLHLHEKGKREILSEYLKIMSPGELNLFYFCFFLCTLAMRRNSKLVVILDEPELHLHSKKIIELITLLESELPQATLWIATHSLHLIPFFEFSEITYIKNGNFIKRTSKIYHQVFNEIIGQSYDNLKMFLYSIDLWQYYEFIAECFCDPESITDDNKADEQFLKLITILKKKHSNNEQINILDYGSGKGRFGNYIDLIEEEQNSTLVNYYYYTFDAYEKAPENIKCLKKHFTTHEELLSINTTTKFDFVLLVNTLHEIDSKSWLEMFELISKILKKEGYLFICEAITLTSGEMPFGDDGYLVLGDHQLKLLFGSNNVYQISLTDYISSFEKRSPEKTYAAIVNQNGLQQVTPDSIRQAIESLKEESFSITKTIFEEKQKRKLEVTGDMQEVNRNIRKYAFYSQQYINAIMALESFRNLNHLSLNINFMEWGKSDSNNETFDSEYLFRQAIKLQAKHGDKDEIIRLLEQCASEGHEKSKNVLMNSYGKYIRRRDRNIQKE